MNIAQLKEMPIGYKTGGGFTMAVKTIKKSWQVGKNWMQQLILMDETGEMLADIKLGPNCQNIRGRIGKEIKVVVCEIQESEFNNKPCKKLYIDQYDIPTWYGEPPLPEDEANWKKENDEIIRSKVRCWLVSACLQGGQIKPDMISGQSIPKGAKKIINELVDFIMKGE